MLDAAARPLLSMLGHSGDIPGAIAAEDVPGALARLTENLARRAAQVSAVPEPSPPSSGDYDSEPDMAVDLATRAGPLRDMLEVATQENDYVYWE